jgi:hypothetical protein
MIAVLIAYIKIRMHFVQLIGLTILMSMLVLSPKDPFEIWLFSMLLLVISFMVFRFLDDAFSVTIDYYCCLFNKCRVGFFKNFLHTIFTFNQFIGFVLYVLETISCVKINSIGKIPCATLLCFNDFIA